MELLQLAYFRVVARLEHMTRAAEELNVTQPALSRAITRLEREVGVPLFDRRGRGLRLTQYGAAFLGHVDRVFLELDDATAELRDMGGMERGSVSLAAGALHWLPGVLEPFLTAYPEVGVIARPRLGSAPLSRRLKRTHHIAIGVEEADLGNHARGQPSLPPCFPEQTLGQEDGRFIVVVAIHNRMGRGGCPGEERSHRSADDTQRHTSRPADPPIS